MTKNGVRLSSGGVRHSQLRQSWGERQHQVVEQGLELFQTTLGGGQMQHQLAASSAQQSSRQEDLGPQGGGLPESFQPRDSLEFTQQVKQHQDGTEGSFRGEELAQAEIIGGQIVLQLR